MSFVNDATAAERLLEWRRIKREKARIERDTQALMDRATDLFGQVDATRKAEITALRDEFVTNLRTILGV